jgi:ABC-type oligopeptide transport system ATPase subunit
MSLLEVKNLKVHFPVKSGRFSRVLAFAALTPFPIGLNFQA